MKKIRWFLCILGLLALVGCADGNVNDIPPSDPAPDVSNAVQSPESEDVHSPAETPQTVSDPVTGYCGNTVTTVHLDGEDFSFWGTDSVNLTDILINLDYAGDLCRCDVEFTVDTEFGDGYGVNLDQSYARHGEGQSPLTSEQVQTIRDILSRNC